MSDASASEVANDPAVRARVLAAQLAAADAPGPRPAPMPAGRPFAWAAYLGASWTWVIGMFLPVLLIRDFGPAAWFVFAIPNVVGAAAMGWVLRSREQSERLVANHAVAARAFSLVTIAFHVYFAVWMLPQFVGPAWACLTLAAALLVALPVLATSIRPTTFAAVAWSASILLLCVVGGTGALGWPSVTPRFAGGLDLLALSVVCLLGFLTCPYLDLTFHRARQACETPAEAKLAFGLGFGGFFLLMIVGTLLYAGALIGGTSRTVGLLIGAHLAVQSVLTVGLHGSAARANGGRPNALWAAVATAAIVGLVAVALEGRGLRYFGMAWGEVGYRGFLAFYGLAFPAYVWLCILPTRGASPPARREWQAFAAAVVVALPFFWVAFLHGQMRWVLVGITVVMLARLVVARPPVAEPQGSRS